jgi:lysophospholipase
MAASIESYAVIDRRGAVEGVGLPVLIVATEGDQLVSPKAIRTAAARLPDRDLLMFDKTAAHEVLREVDAVRDAGMTRIASFLDEKLARP